MHRINIKYIPLPFKKRYKVDQNMPVNKAIFKSGGFLFTIFKEYTNNRPLYLCIIHCKK